MSPSPSSSPSVCLRCVRLPQTDRCTAFRYLPSIAESCRNVVSIFVTWRRQTSVQDCHIKSNWMDWYQAACWLVYDIQPSHYCHNQMSYIVTQIRSRVNFSMQCCWNASIHMDWLFQEVERSRYCNSCHQNYIKSSTLFRKSSTSFDLGGPWQPNLVSRRGGVWHWQPNKWVFNKNVLSILWRYWFCFHFSA